MQKLKNQKQKNFNLLNYQQFLKHNHLKESQSNLKKKLFENLIILKDIQTKIVKAKKKAKTDNIKVFWIDLNKRQTFFLPIFESKLKGDLKKRNSILYTVESKYNNHFLFNYDLNYNLLYYFTKLLFQNKLKKNKIKGRIINRNYKYVFISFLGLILKMSFKNLHKNRRLFYGHWKKTNKNLSSYKVKRLNFKIDSNFFQKSILSRKSYVQEIIENKKKFKKKNKRKYATI